MITILLALLMPEVQLQDLGRKNQKKLFSNNS